jgi:hypothetical protein
MVAAAARERSCPLECSLEAGEFYMAALSTRELRSFTFFLFLPLITGCSIPTCYTDASLLTSHATAENSASLKAPSETTAFIAQTSSASNSAESAGSAFLPEFAMPQFGAAPPPEAGPDIRALPRAEPSPELTAPGAGPQLQTVWGILDFRGFPLGDQMASNGVEFHQLFLLDLNFNIMLWREKRLYLFADSAFWGQKAAPGITNPTQGQFDFSKREFDFDLGAAWNYGGSWEARVFAYSFNNLNRGNSLISPAGFNDGIGLENRYYIGETYAHLGDSEFDQARATFVGAGYYPSKSMEDGTGNQFKPGGFVRAYLTQDLWGPEYYAYTDCKFITSRSFTPTLFEWDAGLAARPIHSLPRLEFRVGNLGMLTVRGGDVETSVYLSGRYVF